MRSALGATALTTVLLLAACGGDPEPRFEAEASAEPSVSSSPTAAPEPEAWEEKTDAGAVAFVEHWIDEFNRMQTTGETDAFQELGTRDCATCSNFVDITQSIYADGSRVVSQGWSVTGADVPPGQSGSSREVSVRIAQAPEIIYQPDGKTETNPGGLITVVATVTWQRGAWLMSDLDFPS